MALPFQPKVGVPELRSKAITLMLCASVMGLEPSNNTNGTRGLPTPKSFEATATDRAEGPPATAVGASVAMAGVAGEGEAHPAATAARIIANTRSRCFT